MLRLHEIGEVVRTRRTELGLSIEFLGALSAVPVNILLDLESGALDDISFVKLSRVLQLLSLSFGEPTTNARKGKRALWMASKNASVSYTREISEEELRLVLRNAECPAGLRSNICSFLDETPLELVIMAVEEAGEDPIARSHIWQNVARLSTTIGSDRNSLWSGHGPSTGIE